MWSRAALAALLTVLVYVAGEKVRNELYVSLLESAVLYRHANGHVLISRCSMANKGYESCAMQMIIDWGRIPDDTNDGWRKIMGRSYERAGLINVILEQSEIQLTRDRDLWECREAFSRSIWAVWAVIPRYCIKHSLKRIAGVCHKWDHGAQETHIESGGFPAIQKAKSDIHMPIDVVSEDQWAGDFYVNGGPRSLTSNNGSFGEAIGINGCLQRQGNIDYASGSYYEPYPGYYQRPESPFSHLPLGL